MSYEADVKRLRSDVTWISRYLGRIETIRKPDHCDSAYFVQPLQDALLDAEELVLVLLEEIRELSRACSASIAADEPRPSLISPTTSTTSETSAVTSAGTTERL